MSDNETRLGNGPRIEPQVMEEVTPGLQSMIERMAEVNISLQSRQTELVTRTLEAAGGKMSREEVIAVLAELPEIMRTMVHHSDLFNRHTDLGFQLLARGVLPPRDRELAILRIGWLCQAPYEWGEHVMVAKKEGITSAEIERVTIGSAAPEWTTHERAVVRAAEELHADAMISDATWATLAETYDDAQLIELPIVIGQYQGVAYYQNSLRLRLHDGNPGLTAR